MSEENHMRIRLIRRVHALRSNNFEWSSKTTPQSIDRDIVVTSAGNKRRCRLILTAHGCSIGSCTMCPLPDEAVPWDETITTEDWLAQLEQALRAQPEIDVLTLYHNGNFFSDKEVPPQRRQAIYARLARSSVETLVVESLPQFITADKLQSAQQALRADQRIEVAIGLQSMDPFLRETVLASPCNEPAMHKALKALSQVHYGVQVFLMYQMPFLTVQEASWSLEESVLALENRYRIHDPTICALRIAPNTIAADLHAIEALKLGNLWDLTTVLERIRLKSSSNRARVAVSLLKPDSPGAPTTDACPACRSRLLDWIAAYNRGRLPGLPEKCSCAGSTVAKPYHKEQVLLRIVDYLQTVDRDFV